MDDWLIRHMHGVLLWIEVLWVAGFLAIFVLYFVIKHRVRAARRDAHKSAPHPPDDTGS